MAFMNCYSMTEIVTDEASPQFAPLWREDKQRKRFLKTCCNDIDTLASLVNADSLGVEIDDVEMTITISIECDKIVMESRQHKLYEIAGKAAEVKFAVSQEDQNKLLICFVFPGIWKHV